MVNHAGLALKGLIHLKLLEIPFWFMSLRIFWDNFVAHSQISYNFLNWKTVLNLFKANFDIIRKPFANQFTDFYGMEDARLKYLKLFCVTRESLYKDPKLSQLLVWEIEVDKFYSLKTDSMCKGITLIP